MSRTARAVLAAVGVLAVLTTLGIAVGVWRLRSAMQAAHAERRRIDALEKRALQRPFTPPADGIITTFQLGATLDVECAVEGVRDRRGHPVRQFEQLEAQGKTDLGVMLRGIDAIFAELDARAEVMDRVGIGFREYDYVRLAIGELPWDGPDAHPVAPGATRWSPRAQEINAALFRAHQARIRRCVRLAQIRQDIDALRRLVSDGRPVFYDAESGDLPPIPSP